MKRSCRGFTLLELMLVVAIVAILSALAGPSYRSVIERQKIGHATTHLMKMSMLISRARNGAGLLPVSLAGLPERGGAGLVVAADLAAAQKALGATGVRSAGGVVVPPAAGNGTLLAFVKA